MIWNKQGTTVEASAPKSSVTNTSGYGTGSPTLTPAPTPSAVAGGANDAMKSASPGNTTSASNSNIHHTTASVPTNQSSTHKEIENEKHVLEVRDFCLFYGQNKALHNIDMKIPAGKITSLIGPSGCGKSTLLRSVNRLNDLIDSVRITGDMLINGDSIYNKHVDVIELRKRMGMVFQKSNPFPMSIFENVVFPLRIDGETRKSILLDVCEKALRGAALWDEVKDRLHTSGLSLSGGQQQRLCIARAIAAEPEVLLMDEPCSALDPIATGKIEDLIHELRGNYTVLIVTHNMQQAARVSDFTAFMYMGKLIEYGPTVRIFEKPLLRQTEDYVTGRFG